MSSPSSTKTEVRARGVTRTVPGPDTPLAPPRWYVPVKAVVDFLLALALLVVTAPIVLVAMALVKLTSRGPAIYSQTRLGKHGQPFTIYKIRTMDHQAEKNTGARWCLPGDNRITRLGRWLRKTHIDELPQLWNVLCGQMSLIGPRPERPEFVPQLEQAIPHYRARLQVRPGLTGLAQVQLPPDTDLASVRLKLAYDLYYVRTVNPWLDARVALATLLHIVCVPFHVIRGLCCLARAETMEEHYRTLPPTAGARKPASVNSKHVGGGDPVPALSS